MDWDMVFVAFEGTFCVLQFLAMIGTLVFTYLTWEVHRKMDKEQELWERENAR